MATEEFCCPAAAARAVSKLTLLDGDQVGILNLDNIMKAVAGLGLTDMEAIKKELLKMVQACNYVPSSCEHDYSRALLGEYKRRYPAKA
ncbi:MAG: hypothetical protein HZB55_20510 [Deltaproteobacteria bacterium]|nr:hypothetical protein [Deltaproteobacteria bacterium]